MLIEVGSFVLLPSHPHPLNSIPSGWLSDAQKSSSSEFTYAILSTIYSLFILAPQFPDLRLRRDTFVLRAQQRKAVYLRVFIVRFNKFVQGCVILLIGGWVVGILYYYGVYLSTPSQTDLSIVHIFV